MQTETVALHPSEETWLQLYASTKDMLCSYKDVLQFYARWLGELVDYAQNIERYVSDWDALATLVNITREQSMLLLLGATQDLFKLVAACESGIVAEPETIKERRSFARSISKLMKFIVMDHPKGRYPREEAEHRMKIKRSFTILTFKIRKEMRSVKTLSKTYLKKTKEYRYNTPRKLDGKGRSSDAAAVVAERRSGIENEGTTPKVVFDSAKDRRHRTKPPEHVLDATQAAVQQTSQEVLPASSEQRRKPTDVDSLRSESESDIFSDDVSESESTKNMTPPSSPVPSHSSEDGDTYPPTPTKTKTAPSDQSRNAIDEETSKEEPGDPTDATDHPVDTFDTWPRNTTFPKSDRQDDVKRGLPPASQEHDPRDTAYKSARHCSDDRSTPDRKDSDRTDGDDDKIAP